MESVLRIAISNAALATVAAVLAWIAGKLVRKPALTHALWLIVLLKLVTPPIWTLSMRVPTERPKMVEQPTATIPIAPDAKPDDRQVNLATANPGDDQTADLPEGDASPIATGDDSMAPALAPPPPIPSPLAVSAVVPRQGWTILVLIGEIAWVAGAAFCLAIGVCRIIAFRRVLRYAVAAEPHYQRRAEWLSHRLGLAESPRVELVPGAVCPMLWAAAGKPRVLVPMGLWERLDARQRDTLLLHELAHLRRRDHWVRWIELLATALYWWHPVCWWARHELREAEEQCCDAWVLWAMPDSFRDYASALLEAVDFVSIRPSVPLLASGMGQFGHLKRRLTMLKQGNVARALTWSGFAASCGTGALLLSFAPTFAQDSSSNSNQQSTKSEKRDEAATTPPAAEQTPVPVAVETRVATTTTDVRPTVTASVSAAAPASPDAPAAPRAVLVSPSGTISIDMAPASPAPEALPKPRTPNDLFREDMAAEDPAGNKAPGAALRNQQAQLEKARRDVADLSRRLQQAAERLKQLEMDSARKDFEKAQQDMARAREQMQNRFQFQFQKAPMGLPPLPPGEKGDAGAKTPDGNFFPGGTVTRSRTPDNDRDRERRLDKVEQQLSQLLDEVKHLRSERDSRKAAPDAGDAVQRR